MGGVEGVKIEVGGSRRMDIYDVIRKDCIRIVSVTNYLASPKQTFKNVNF